MDIYTLDAETFFSDDFTLKKLTTEAYCRDARFKVHGWGVRNPLGDLTWYTHDEFAVWAGTVDWSNAGVLCHHSHFDCLILSHTYNIRPGLILCSLSMARALIGNHLSVSLESLAAHYGLEAKRVPYERIRGKQWDEMDAALQRELAEGCLWDVELTWQIFQRLMAGDYRAVQR